MLYDCDNYSSFVSQEMILTSALVFLLALYLCIQSTWSLASFIRLRRAKKDNTNFGNQCKLGSSYVDTGYSLAIVSLVGSILVLFVSGGSYVHALVTSRKTTIDRGSEPM